MAVASFGKPQENGPVCSFLFLFICTSSLLPSQSLDLATQYMESSCGVSLNLLTSFQLDSSTGLTYLNQQNCALTVTTTSGHFVVTIITRFELETPLTGSCTDYLDFYDGTSTSASKLNTNTLCGSGSSIPSNITSTGQSMTLHFVTDNSGVYLGFSVTFVSATNVPCSSSSFECNSSICIDSTLECDSIDQCGDSSDESNCATTQAEESSNLTMIVAITLSVVFLIIIVAVVAYKMYMRNYWKKFLNTHIDDDDGIIEPGPSYPITHKYYKGRRGHPTSYLAHNIGEHNAAQALDGNAAGSGKGSESEIVASTSSVVT